MSWMLANYSVFQFLTFSLTKSCTRWLINTEWLVALIVFTILEHYARTLTSSSSSQDDDVPSLAEEIRLLRNSLEFYKPRVTSDPLGWGLEAMYDQFLKGNPRRDQLADLEQTELEG